MKNEDKRIALIGVECVEEHEDGSADYLLSMDEASRSSLMEAGVNFILSCAVSGLDMEDAYTLIMGNGEEDPVLEALKLCPDVRLSEVPELIKLRQKELGQEPDDER